MVALRTGKPRRFMDSPEDHAAFHRAMEEDPEAAKVYADYLEENGKPEIANIVRSNKTQKVHSKRSFIERFHPGWHPGEFRSGINFLELRSSSDPDIVFNWGGLDPRQTEDASQETDWHRGIKREKMSRGTPNRLAALTMPNSPQTVTVSVPVPQPVQTRRPVVRQPVQQKQPQPKQPQSRIKKAPSPPYTILPYSYGGQQQMKRGNPTRFMSDESPFHDPRFEENHTNPEHEAAFHKAIRENPNNQFHWLVYADYLDHHDRGHEADAIREMIVHHAGVGFWYSPQPKKSFALESPPSKNPLDPDRYIVTMAMPSHEANGLITLRHMNLRPHQAASIAGKLTKSGYELETKPEHGLNELKTEHPEHFRKGEPKRFAEEHHIPDQEESFIDLINHNQHYKDPTLLGAYADYLEETQPHRAAEIEMLRRVFHKHVYDPEKNDYLMGKTRNRDEYPHNTLTLYPKEYKQGNPITMLTYQPAEGEHHFHIEDDNEENIARLAGNLVHNGATANANFQMHPKNLEMLRQKYPQHFQSEEPHRESKKSDDWVGQKIKKLQDEGKPHDQSIAIALNMAAKSKKNQRQRQPRRFAHPGDVPFPESYGKVPKVTIKDPAKFTGTAYKGGRTGIIPLSNDHPLAKHHDPFGHNIIALADPQGKVFHYGKIIDKGASKELHLGQSIPPEAMEAYRKGWQEQSHIQAGGRPPQEVWDNLHFPYQKHFYQMAKNDVANFRNPGHSFHQDLSDDPDFETEHFEPSNQKNINHYRGQYYTPTAFSRVFKKGMPNLSMLLFGGRGNRNTNTENELFGIPASDRINQSKSNETLNRSMWDLWDDYKANNPDAGRGDLIDLARKYEDAFYDHFENNRGQIHWAPYFNDPEYLQKHILDHIDVGPKGSEKPKEVMKRGKPSRFNGIGSFSPIGGFNGGMMGSLKKKEDPERMSESFENEEAQFHRAMEQSGEDRTPWLIYSDWLEENGCEQEAHALRDLLGHKAVVSSQDHSPQQPFPQNTFNLYRNHKLEQRFSPGVPQYGLEIHIPAKHDPTKSFTIRKSVINGSKAAPIVGNLLHSGYQLTSEPQDLEKLRQDHPEHFRRGKPQRMSEDIDSEEAGFHRAMNDERDRGMHDSLASKVYADWLEERGKPTIAKVIRSKDLYRHKVRENEQNPNWKPGEFYYIPGISKNSHHLYLHPLDRQDSYLAWHYTDPQDQQDLINEADVYYDQGKDQRKEKA